MNRKSVFALVLACLMTLTACESRAASGEPEGGGDEAGVTLYDCGGLEAALPEEYGPRLLVETSFPGAEPGWLPLLSVYEKASYEASQADFGQGGGFLFGLLRMDQASLEQLMSSDGSGMEVFATDGEWYYAYTYPTDVQFYRPGGVFDTESQDWEDWEELNALGPAARDDFLVRNGLQAFSVQDLTSQPFAVDGDHVCLRYYPYYLKDGDTRLYEHLLLSQPARQGEGGIWAVERWMDVHGNQYLYFPDSGKPSGEHYADLQALCDAGERRDLLTPAGAAADFAADYFGHETVPESFAQVPEVDEAYIQANQRLVQLALDLMGDRSVEPGALLEAVGSAPSDSWGVLGRNLYGSDWFQPLMEAVEAAAVGEDQQSRDRNTAAFFLATLDARTDFRTPLLAVLEAQWKADPEAFAAAVETFAPEEQEVLSAQLGFNALGIVSPGVLPPDTPEFVEPLPED